MLRNIDAAWDGANGRRVFGFFIVKELTDEWLRAVNETVSERALAESLPHRLDDVKEQIADSFLGVTTWERVCDAFDFDYFSLPDTVSEATTLREVRAKWGLTQKRG